MPDRRADNVVPARKHHGIAINIRSIGHTKAKLRTAEYSVQLKRPTPSGQPVQLRARVMESSADRAVVEATLSSGGTVCATGRGTFVAVKPGHPAYHRW